MESLKTVLVMEANLIFMIDTTVSVVRQLVRDLQNQFSTAGLTGMELFLLWFPVATIFHLVSFPGHGFVAFFDVNFELNQGEVLLP